MKNLSLALNIILLVAVAVLFYLHFSSGKTSSASSSPSGVTASDIKVAFVNSDSLLKYYDYFKVNRDQLEAKGLKMDADLTNRAQSLQRDINSYRTNAGNLTANQARAMEEQISQKQQNLRMYQESLSQEILNDEGKLNEDVYFRVTNYLKTYSQEKGIQVVLKFNTNSDLLYGGEGLNITQDLITGLNQAYKDEKANPKPDSTNVKK